jgi:hypothetical protein
MMMLLMIGSGIEPPTKLMLAPHPPHSLSKRALVTEGDIYLNMRGSIKPSAFDWSTFHRPH